MQVPHILASSSSVGHTVVWDMRKTEKPVITFNTGNALVISIKNLDFIYQFPVFFYLVWFFVFVVDKLSCDMLASPHCYSAGAGQHNGISDTGNSIESLGVVINVKWFN